MDKKTEKLIAIIIGSLVLCVGLGYGLWVNSYTDDFSATIDSDDPILEISVFSDLNIITTNSSNTQTTSSSFKVIGADMTLKFNSTEERTDSDLSDECDSFQTDCVVSYEFDGNPIVSGTDVNLTEENTYVLETEVACQRSSCGHVLNVSVIFE